MSHGRRQSLYATKLVKFNTPPSHHGVVAFPKFSGRRVYVTPISRNPVDFPGNFLREISETGVIGDSRTLAIYDSGSRNRAPRTRPNRSDLQCYY